MERSNSSLRQGLLGSAVLPAGYHQANSLAPGIRPVCFYGLGLLFGIGIGLLLGLVIMFSLINSEELFSALKNDSLFETDPINFRFYEGAKEHSQLVRERDALKSELATLQDEHKCVCEAGDVREGQLGLLQSDLKTLQDAHTALMSWTDVLVSERDNLTEELIGVKNELTSLQYEYKALKDAHNNLMSERDYLDA